MNNMIKKIISILFIFFSLNTFVNAQDTLMNYIIDYTQPKDYVLAGISIQGIDNLSKTTIKDISGLKKNQIISIPGNDISTAINKLWKQNLFANINIENAKIINDSIFLNIILKEYPRLSKFKFKGDISKSDITNIKEDLQLMRGKILTKNLIKNSINKIEQFYIDKGFLNISVNHYLSNDSLTTNSSILILEIDKSEKIKIKDIVVYGRKEIVNKNKTFFNNKDTIYAISNKKLKKSMKETKVKNKWRFFKASKFIKANYEDDKGNIITEYNNKGYRDAKIINDTTYLNNDKTISIEITLKKESHMYLAILTL